MHVTRITELLRHAWKEWRGILVFALLIVFFRSAIADWYVVPTGSMQPTILIGDRVFVSRIAYDIKLPFSSIVIDELDDPQRGDLAVFASPYSDERLIKRVVGLPGDVIAIQDDILFLNGTPTTYLPDGEFAGAIRTEDFELRGLQFIERLPELEHPVLHVPYIDVPRDFGPITIPDEHYFMLGDNRNNSRDSRSYGPVPRDILIGRASRVLWSLDTRDEWDFRGERILEPLR